MLTCEKEQIRGRFNSSKRKKKMKIAPDEVKLSRKLVDKVSLGVKFSSALGDVKALLVAVNGSEVWTGNI